MNVSSSKSWYENRILNSLVSDIKNPSHHLYYVLIFLSSCNLFQYILQTSASFAFNTNQDACLAEQRRGNQQHLLKDSASKRAACQTLVKSWPERGNRNTVPGKGHGHSPRGVIQEHDKKHLSERRAHKCSVPVWRQAWVAAVSWILQAWVANSSSLWEEILVKRSERFWNP